MTEFLFRGTALGLLSGGLAACAMTPSYPTAAPVATPAAAAAAPPAAAAPTPPPSAPEAVPTPPPAAVESQSLPPVAAAQSPAATPAPVATAEVPPPPVVMTPVPDDDRPALRQSPPATRYTATGKVTEAHRMFRDYVVQKGDHLDAIARDLETTRETLLEANHIKKPNDLRPGQHLKVPVEKVYVAASGDSVSAVARRFDLSAGDLADLNAISESHRLRAGEELALPATFHDRGPVPVLPTRSYARYAPPPVVYRGGGGYTPPSGGYYTPVPPAGAHAPSPYPSVAMVAPPTRTDSQVQEAGKGRFVSAGPRGEILQAFGVQDVDRRNDGVDIRSPMGTPVHAAAAGEVVYAGDQVPGFGNLVLVKHADGWVTAYAHLAHVDVRMRDTVAQDQEIGQVGQTGGVSEPELHFEVRYAATPIEKARPINPLLVLPE